MEDLVPRTIDSSSRREIRFSAISDGDSKVWVATGEDRITTEAATRDDLLSRLSTIVPDVLSSREEATASLLIIVDWQELGTVDQTILGKCLSLKSEGLDLFGRFG